MIDQAGTPPDGSYTTFECARQSLVIREANRGRKVHIPKGDGRATRPIGIPTLEDKVLQRAVVALLEPLYEQDFRNCSYGFRPKRSAHQAIREVWKGGRWLGH